MIKLQKVSQSDNLIQKNLKANSLKTLHKFLKQVRLKKFLAVKKPLLKAEKVKNIAVVGGGPAGIIFAITAARRGHNVELIEKNDKLGGKVICGSVPKIKFDFENYLKYLNNQVKEAEKLPNFKVNLNTEATTEYLKKKNYDSVVFAYGTKNITPKIPGIEEVNVVQATDLLTNPKLLGDSEKIVVVGGGVVGCETAYYLKYEHNKDVKVVEMLPYIMDGACTANRGHLIYYLNKENVELINCAKVISFNKGKVNIVKNFSKGVPNPNNTWQPILPANIQNPLAKKIGDETVNLSLDADLVVLAIGGKSDVGMYFEAQRLHAAPEIYNIGDSFKAGRVLEASRAAYNLALRI